MSAYSEASFWPWMMAKPNRVATYVVSQGLGFDCLNESGLISLVTTVPADRLLQWSSALSVLLTNRAEDHQGRAELEQIALVKQVCT